MAYNADKVDDILVKFEKAAERTTANKTSVVKLRAAERDLLAAAEVARDLLVAAVKGDKNLLAEVFGGSCQRFHRFKNTMNEVELTAMHASDQRWGMLTSAIETIEEVLKQLGQFKPWTKGSKAPESIVYRGAAARRYSPGEKVKWECELEGAEATEFSVAPELPAGLRLNPASGMIIGNFRPDLEVEEKTYVVSASNSAGSTTTELTFSVQVPPPESLAFPGFPNSLCIGEAVGFQSVVTGGPARDYSVKPGLPSGLEIDKSTGAIIGAPMEKKSEQEYVVKAANPSGEVSCALNFAVVAAPPIGLVYSGLQPIFPTGQVIYLLPRVKTKGSENAAAAAAAANAGADGDVKSQAAADLWKKVRRRTSAVGLMTRRRSSAPGMDFSVAPDLPEGLTLTHSGIITGTPSTPAEDKTYKVTVKNDSGSFSTEIAFGIKLSPPSNLKYADVADSYSTGQPMSLSPVVEGMVTEWSVDPALPSGLSLDAAMGFVSGIPTQVAEKSTWNVKAKNAEGDATFGLSFAVRRAAPSSLQYPELSEAYPVLRPLCIDPCVEGDVEEFTVSPALPAGVNLDSKTGVIKGTPSGTVDDKTYVVTAKNETGATTAEVKFGVRVMPPDNLSYPSVDDVYGVGEEVNLEPCVEGGATIWAVEPSLPKGMMLDAASGNISGVPDNVSPEKSYVITASNDAGGTSVVISFAVTAPAPEGLSYPSASEDYIIKEQMSIEPSLEKGLCMTFSVAPALPAGLTIAPKTGAISGAPDAAVDKKSYKVTAKNPSGSTSTELSFSCSEPPKSESVDEKFAARVEEITDLAGLMPEPPKGVSLGNWMIWMVHRVYLNDPTLSDLNFSNLQMPPPHVEPRIAPKLMNAMVWNSHITSLQLSNSNMMKPQGHDLAESLKQNVTLKILNMESNFLDSESLRAVAESVKENKETALEQWRLASQQCLGEFFGRPLEQAVAELVDQNKTIVKLSFPCQDPHWRDRIDRAILRNVDIARRARKGAGASEDQVAAIDKQLKSVSLNAAPTTKAAWEVFEDDDAKLKIARLSLVSGKKMPTKEQLQAFARKEGTALKFSEVAPLMKDFRGRVLGCAVGSEVVVTEPTGTTAKGVLRAWSEKNDRISLDIWTSESARFNYTSQSACNVDVSDEFADWLRPN